LDRLLLVIARYLAEHGVPFYQKWLQPYLAMSGSQFWPLFRRSPPQPSLLSGGDLSCPEPSG
jgi:hypothetical protein